MLSPCEKKCGSELTVDQALVTMLDGFHLLLPLRQPCNRVTLADPVLAAALGGLFQTSRESSVGDS